MIVVLFHDWARLIVHLHKIARWWEPGIIALIIGGIPLYVITWLGEHSSNHEWFDDAFNLCGINALLSIPVMYIFYFSLGSPFLEIIENLIVLFYLCAIWVGAAVLGFAYGIGLLTYALEWEPGQRAREKTMERKKGEEIMEFQVQEQFARTTGKKTMLQVMAGRSTDRHAKKKATRDGPRPL